MPKITNTSKAVLDLPGVKLQPGQSHTFSDLAQVASKPILEAWKKAKVITVEADAPAAPARAPRTAPSE